MSDHQATEAAPRVYGEKQRFVGPFWVALRWLEHGFAVLGVLAFLSVIFHFVNGA